MTQDNVFFLEANRFVYEKFKAKSGIRSFDHTPFLLIMKSEFFVDYQEVRGGDADGIVEMILSLYRQFDRWKKKDGEITATPRYSEAQIQDLKFLELREERKWN